jgi:phage repressor protein C with HTH and peptisase S24 domain
MNDIEDHFSRQIEARLKDLGENAYSFEQKMGWPADALRSVLRKDAKRARPNLERIKTLCDALGLEIYIGPPRGIQVPSPTSDPSVSEFTRVPVYDAFLAAGDGVSNSDDGPVDYMMFKKDHLRKLGVSIPAAVIAQVSGKSMMPTIFPGDHVLIDTSRRTVEGRTSKFLNTRKNRPPVYAFIDDGHARVKRMMGDPTKGVRVWSDNPMFEPEFIGPEEFDALHIIGRVMWWGHSDP